MHNAAADAIADALPIELRLHAAQLAALLADLAPAALVARLEARPVLIRALVTLVGQLLIIADAGTSVAPRKQPPCARR